MTSFFIKSSSDADNEDSHNVLDEFDFGPNQTIHIRVTCPFIHVDI